MKDKQQAGVTPRKYDDAFRREAVRLWKSSGRSAELTARDLGISVFQLYDWNRAELARITEQRDILKKAAGILSEPSPSGMPGSKR